MLDWLRDNKGVEIFTINCGTDVEIYNAYSPGNAHASRLAQTIEAVNLELTGKAPPAGRRYLKLEFYCELIETRATCSMPPLQYYFA